jgi:hypothetical protein
MDEETEMTRTDTVERAIQPGLRRAMFGEGLRGLAISDPSAALPRFAHGELASTRVRFLPARGARGLACSGKVVPTSLIVPSCDPFARS